MQFPTLTFALFFTAVLCISWLLRPRYLLWRVFIVGASWIFYGYWDARFVALLAASTAGNYLVGLAIYRSRQTAAPPLAAVAVHGSVALKERDEAPVPSPGWPRRTRWLLGLGIALNLGVLAWFKYWQFFT
jgi:alginate O-acetyltransferase complex protein AlgI